MFSSGAQAGLLRVEKAERSRKRGIAQAPCPVFLRQSASGEAGWRAEGLGSSREDVVNLSWTLDSLVGVGAEQTLNPVSVPAPLPSPAAPGTLLGPRSCAGPG